MVNPSSSSLPSRALLRAKPSSMMNSGNGTKVSPCITPAVMSNSCVSPSGVKILALVFIYMDWMACTSLGVIMAYEIMILAQSLACFVFQLKRHINSDILLETLYIIGDISMCMALY